jgi:hypothetical protein
MLDIKSRLHEDPKAMRGVYTMDKERGFSE